MWGKTIYILGLAVGLSADAFAVSVCKGLSAGRVRKRHLLIVGGYFGFFQALMPLLGWALSSAFASHIRTSAPVIAFMLLSLIGGNMIREGFRKQGEHTDSSFSPAAILPLALATSIDAMIAGTTLAFNGYDLHAILSSVGIIGLTTFVLSAVGVKVGSIFGIRYKSGAELTGGAILILLGVYTLAEGLLNG